MCFSPEASFAGGIIISAIGVATVRKVHNPSQIVFASIPLFFGIQQIAEGFFWMTLPGHDFINLQKISTYLFLIMAQVIWPLMIPVSIMLMEENIKRRKNFTHSIGYRTVIVNLLFILLADFQCESGDLRSSYTL